MKVMEIVNPIFIIGIQRSGTTILDNLFTRHRDTAYFEAFSSILYKKPYLFRFIPLLIKLQRISKGRNFSPNSSEGRVWRRFFTEIDYLEEKDVTDEIKRYYYSAIKFQLKAFNAKQFVNKNPANCLRIKWINKMFPDAKYIIIWRDSKAVVSSIFQKMQKYHEYEINHTYEHGYKGYVTVKEKFGKNVSDLEACINYYNYLKKTLTKDIKIIDNRMIETSYEKFIDAPKKELKRLYDFTGLKWYDELEEKIPNKLEINNNEKWRELSKKEQELLTNEFD
jgi:hypothetical protein